MKYWHRFQAWILEGKAKREHRKLAKYVRQSAQEICLWRDEIAILEYEAAQAREKAGIRPRAENPAVEEGKIVAMHDAMAA